MVAHNPVTHVQQLQQSLRAMKAQHDIEQHGLESTLDVQGAGHQQLQFMLVFVAVCSLMPYKCGTSHREALCVLLPLDFGMSQLWMVDGLAGCALCLDISHS
jgi:hypothetical protein